MSTITKEFAQDIIRGHGYGVAPSAVEALARIALASLEAEPVCVIDQSNLDYLKSGSDADVWPASRTEMGDVLLYRAAPPAPVSVPAAMEMDDDFDSAFEHGKAVGWNAYRAAMLQGAENAESRCSNSQVIHDGWVMVPVDLTPDMRAAWDSAPYTDDDDNDMQAAYRAMIAAAPQQEAE